MNRIATISSVVVGLLTATGLGLSLKNEFLHGQKIGLLVQYSDKTPAQVELIGPNLEPIQTDSRGGAIVPKKWVGMEILVRDAMTSAELDRFVLEKTFGTFVVELDEAVVP